MKDNDRVVYEKRPTHLFCAKCGKSCEARMTIGCCNPLDWASYDGLEYKCACGYSGHIAEWFDRGLPEDDTRRMGKRATEVFGG